MHRHLTCTCSPLGRLAIDLVRSHDGLVSIDLSSVAGLKEYGAARFADDLAAHQARPALRDGGESETLGVPLEDVARVPVLKLGADGCVVAGRVRAPHVKEVDATGAGDALAAAFCVSYLDGATPVEAAERAVVVASGSVTKAGARPS